MSMVEELEEKALQLSEQDRASLAAHLLASLPGPSCDDDGIAEAERRVVELEENPGMEINLEELERRLAARRE
ncbi:MAG: addiction module protein [Limisphaerales bacterium]